MAVTVTQQRDSAYTKTLHSIPSKKYTIHTLDDGTNGATIIEAGPGNWLARVKCVGTVSEWIAVNIWDMDGNVVFTDLHIDEADEVLGPFSKVQYGPPAEQSGSSTETIQALVWERNNG